MSSAQRPELRRAPMGLYGVCQARIVADLYKKSHVERVVSSDLLGCALFLHQRLALVARINDKLI